MNVAKKIQKLSHKIKKKQENQNSDVLFFLENGHDHPMILPKK